MQNTQILVHDELGTGAVELIHGLKEAFPAVHFLALDDARGLSKALEARQSDALIVLSGGDGCAEYVLEVARRHPALPLLVLGASAPGSLRSRQGSTVVVDSRELGAALCFLREDVLGAARGAFRGVALASVLQILQAERRTCALHVKLGGRRGMLVMRNGALVDARYRSMEAREAALEILAWLQAEVCVSPAPAPAPPTLDEPLDFLLFEAARLHDEREAGQARRASSPPPDASTFEWPHASVPQRAMEAFLEEAMRIRGIRAIDVIDLDRHERILRKTLDGNASISVDHLISFIRCAMEIAYERTSRTRIDEVVLDLSSSFKVFRPIDAASSLVLCASFDPKEITLGMAKMRFGVAIDALFASMMHEARSA